MNGRRACWHMFFMGLFIKTQVHLIGYIGLSELVIVFVAPFIFLKNYTAMKRDGMMPIMNLALMAIVGSVLSSLANGSDFARFIRGFAQTYTTWAALVVGYHLLRQNLLSYRWFLLGGFLSGLLSIYIMQGAAVTYGGFERTGDEAVEAVTTSVLFFTGRILPAINLPLTMFYLQCPYLYAVIAPIMCAILSLWMSDGSGRGGFVVSILSALIILLAGRQGRGLRMVKKNFWLLIIIGIVALSGAKSVYSWAASSGRLGENAERKFIAQTQRGSDALSILISGRTDFFVGLYACLQKPIVGYGPWPADRYGYRAYFLTKYGTDDDIRNAYEYADRFAMKTIPAHSHIVGYWLEYGILGLPFWLYVLWLMFRYFRHDIDKAPALFGWLALAIPGWAWGILFAPYASRVGIPVLIVVLILIRAKNRQLPQIIWR